jgi:glycosyltransferase involved in cell wall biosynthesis
MKKLKEKAKNNIEFKGYLFPDKSKIYLEKAKAFVFCGEEDFGIALLEPQVCGTPVIAYASGGALDTVIHNETGILFKNQTQSSLTKAITLFEKTEFNCDRIRKHSLNFSVDIFKENFNYNLEKILEESE